MKILNELKSTASFMDDMNTTTNNGLHIRVRAKRTSSLRQASWDARQSILDDMRKALSPVYYGKE